MGENRGLTSGLDFMATGRLLCSEVVASTPEQGCQKLKGPIP